MNLKHYFIGILLYLYNQVVTCSTETINYISTERPAVTWFDTTFFRNFTLISHRVNRQDPKHYVDLYMYTLRTMGNDIKMDFYFYQFLTNRYRPSFVEMHFRFCDMLRSDLFFGIAIKNTLSHISCPITPGEHNFKNMSISYVPKGFPFVKGRIFCNVTLEQDGGTTLVAAGHIDMEIKVSRMKKDGKY